MDIRNSTRWVLFITIVVVQLGYNVAVPFSSSTSLLQRMLTPNNGRIINGTEAAQSNTKYQVSIRYRNPDATEYGAGAICSGSLISDNVVLSSANCFIDYEFANGTYLDDHYFIVVMGNVDRFQKDKNTLVFDIKRTVKHEEIFNMNTFKNDLALIVLNASVPADHPTVKPVTLNGGYLESGTVCQSSGWGATANATGTQHLMSVDLPIVPFDTCRRKTETVFGLNVLLGMLCAGYFEGNSGSCSGDTGAPLVCNDLQAGIASWGNACKVGHKPSTFTDVAFYKDWILSKVAENMGTLPTFVGTITNGTGSTGGGNNGTTGDGGGDSGEGDGAMSTYKNSIFLAIAMVAINTILSKF